MSTGTSGFTLQSGVVDSESAWKLLTDTDWMRRLAGTRPIEHMGIERVAKGYPRIQGAYQGPMGGSRAFVETDTSWVAGRHFRQVRAFEGVLKRSLYELTLKPEGSGVRVELRTEIDVAGRLARLVAGRNMKEVEIAWAEVVAQLPVPGGPLPELLGSPLSPTVASAMERWSERLGKREVPGALSRHVALARPMELAELRPYALAASWGLPRAQVLGAFLEGVVLGIFDLNWVVRCPLCCAATDVLNELAQVASSARCDTCQTEFEADPDETVEAVFAPHPTLGCAPIERFCTRNPAVAPDVHMVQVLAPGERRQVEVPLSAGIWLLSAGAASEPTELQVRPGEGQVALRWEPGAQLGGAVLREGMLALDLENTGATHERVLLTQPARSEGRVTVSSLASFPTFRRHFGHEGVATDVRLKARHVALLFTDLASSVAFYRSVGDGAAFSFVKSHVDVLRPVLDQHGGAIVKSTGDGLLCAFDDSSAALACALEMMRRYNAYCAEREGESPAMRIGIHAGPTLIVRTSWAPLDYYGMSVNLAARAEGQGAPGDIVWTQAVAQAPGVSEVLEREGLVPSLSSAQVKGLTEPMDFFRVSVGGGR